MVADLEASVDPRTRRVRLSWNAPLDTAVEPTKYYVIKFREEGPRWKWIDTVFIPARQHGFELQLHELGRYRFHVGSLAMAGAGTPAQVECELGAARSADEAEGAAATRTVSVASGSAPAPRSQLDDASTGTHLVQFYDAPETRAEAAAAWTGAALRRGGGAILVCTPESAAPILSNLRKEGLDAEALVATGRLAVLDARAALARFMIHSGPEPTAFRETFQRALERVRASCGDMKAEVHAWGEMVNILADAGDLAGARAIERLLNEAIREERFRLMCSYPASGFLEASRPELLAHVCETHDALAGEESRGFEQATGEALAEVFGAGTDEVVRNVASSVGLAPGALPAAVRALASLQREAPAQAARVMALARVRWTASRPAV